MRSVSITGGTGFVGRGLIEALKQTNCQISQLNRMQHLDGVPEWHIEKNIDVVIHAAARVHVMNEIASDPLAEFRKANVEGTLNLARQAAKVGVERFVFISSVKVNGELTLEKPFTPFDVPAPFDYYSVSKWEAEQGLLALSQETGLEVVIVRPPLVYGPGVCANFLKLMRLVDMGIPLPLGAIHNRRSMVALDNLVSLITACVQHPAAAGKTFMVSDDEDISISELLCMIAEAMGKRPLLLPVPKSIIAGVAALLGKSSVANRLLGSLQVDITHTKTTLGWQPVISIRESIGKTVTHFLTQR